MHVPWCSVRPKSLFYLGLLLTVTAAAGAQGVDLRQVAGSGGAADGFLKPDQAFVLTAESESPDRVTLRWQIAKDYYLYRDKIAVSTVTPDANVQFITVMATKMPFVGRG